MLGQHEKHLVNYEPLGKWFTSFSIVVPTSQVGYYSYKPIESVVYCFYNITMENVCQRRENILYFRDEVAYSQQICHMTQEADRIEY